MRHGTAPMFAPGETRQQVTRHWYATKDGDPQAIALYEQHYSCHHYADGRPRKLFVGPGQKLVLIGADADALFVWRKFIDDTGQQGVNCAVFRNQSRVLASELIREAEEVAWKRWPGERLYTYVNGRAVRNKRAPGECFLWAGWRYVRDAEGELVRTKERQLLILERLA